MKAITGFLQEARSKLAPYNVFTAADIFGYVCWNQNDTDIGQKLDAIASAVDYLRPCSTPPDSSLEHRLSQPRGEPFQDRLSLA